MPLFAPVRRFTTHLLVALTVLAIAQTSAVAQERPSVVTSFTILADLVSAIGGNRVDVATIVGAGGDAHAFEPSPADARAVAEAGLVVVNGLNFEPWIDRLISATGFAGQIAVASDGVHPLAGGDNHRDEEDGHDDGEFDPHAWQDAANVKIYVENIAAALSELDPEGEAVYAANLANYLAELDALDEEIRAAIAALPADSRTIVTSHDAFGYFGAAYGLEFLAPQGINPEAAPGAQAAVALIEQIKAEGIDAVFVEALTDPRLIEQIARETGAAIGGLLYSDTLSETDGPAATYLDMMRHNIRTLAASLGG